MNEPAGQEENERVSSNSGALARLGQKNTWKEGGTTQKGAGRAGICVKL